ncbi:MAG: DUF4302 domain-containing protein [Tenacibaculum sp.]
MKAKINKIHLFFVFALLLLSCNKSETEQIFEDSSTVRKEKREQELRNLLLSSEQGWKVTYFTDNTQLGGFAFLFKFIDDTQVEMATDFNNGYTKMQSEYDILYSSTTKLSFSTKNYIHDLSDSANPPDSGLTGRGYKGDFEFLYYGAEGDDIIFRTNRDFIELRFSKATENDWSDFHKHELIKANIDGQVGKSVFRILKIDNKLYNFSYDTRRRFATNNAASKDNLNFGIGLTPTGIIIEPAIDIDNSKINEFTYDSSEDKFIAKLEDGSEIASIFYDSSPAFPYTGYQDINSQSLLYNELSDQVTETNEAFRIFLEDYRNSLSPYGISNDPNEPIRFAGIQLNDLLKPLSFLKIVVTFNNNPINNGFWFDFKKSVVDNKLVFSPTGKTNASPEIKELVKPLTDIIFDPKGHHVRSAGTLDGYSNKIFTFTPASNTQYIFEVFAI